MFAGKIFKLTVFVRGCGRERGEAANWDIECAGGPVAWKHFALLSVTIGLIIQEMQGAGQQATLYTDTHMLIREVQ